MNTCIGLWTLYDLSSQSEHCSTDGQRAKFALYTILKELGHATITYQIERVGFRGAV